MHRALWEFRVRGVVTNLRFLDQLITHARFAHGEYTTRFIDETPELFRWPRKRDRATRILSYLGATIVNGNDETRGRARPPPLAAARPPPPRPGGVRPRRRGPAAAAVLGGVLGRGQVRRGDAFPARGSLAAARAVARAPAEPAAADAAALRQCGGLCELSRQRRAL